MLPRNLSQRNADKVEIIVKLNNSLLRAGFYWTISYVYGIIQTVVLNKLYSPDKLKAQAEAEYALRMKQVDIEAKKVLDTDKDDSVLISSRVASLNECCALYSSRAASSSIAVISAFSASVSA